MRIWQGVVQTMNPQHTISEVISAFRPAALTTAEVTGVAYKKLIANVNAYTFIRNVLQSNRQKTDRMCIYTSSHNNPEINERLQ